MSPQFIAHSFVNNRVLWFSSPARWDQFLWSSRSGTNVFIVNKLADTV